VPLLLSPLLRSGQAGDARSSFGLARLATDVGRGLPGQLVIPDDARALALGGRRVFFDLEVVAWQRDDGALVYGQVQLDENETQASAPTPPAAAAQLAQAGSHSDDAMDGVANVIVDVGLGVRRAFLPSLLWTFPVAGSAAALAAPPPSNDAGAAGAAVDLETRVQVDDADGSRTRAGVVPRVSRQQYHEALISLLASAGLDAQLDAEGFAALAQTTVEQRSAMEHMNSEMHAALARIGELERTMRERESALKCPICSE
jgi:hypothetical protein